MKTILEVTNQTPKERNEMLREAFFFWAGKYTNTRTQLQIVLCSKIIQNWFSNEYKKNEDEFLDLVNRLPEASVKDNNAFYNRVMQRVYEVYPSVFLNEILEKNNEITKFSIN